MAALKDLFSNPNVAELELAGLYAELKANPQRERNFEAFAQTGLPHRRVEAWKYSDLRTAVQTLPDAEEEVELTSAFASVDAYIVQVGNGVSGLPKGMRVASEENLTALGGAEDLPVAALGAALTRAGQSLLIEVTHSPEKPVHFVFDAASANAFQRVSFVVRKGVQVAVMESHIRSGGFSSIVLEYNVEAGASLERFIYQKADMTAVQIATCIIHLADGARLCQSGIGFGAKLARLETQVYHHGESAKARINGAYLVGDGYHLDQTSLVRHAQPHCETEQLVKGAVMDGGRAVFQGKFFVAKKAQKTAAQMAHNALILENGGEVNAKPELEIYADDVECAHGNTVGALDETALFYMRQRGIPETQARALLTRAFIAEALDDMPEELAEILMEEAGAWLTERL